MWRTDNAGKTWSDITPTNINGQDWIPYDITISSDDENTLWIARTSMYGGSTRCQGYEVFKSSDGGMTWDNWSTSTLDNINATNIEHQRGSDGGVYLGTRDTVYYRNNTMTDWEIYDNNLPKSTTSTQLYLITEKENYLMEPIVQHTRLNFTKIVLHLLQISADRLTINCLNDTVRFVDHSARKWVQMMLVGNGPSPEEVQAHLI